MTRKKRVKRPKALDEIIIHFFLLFFITAVTIQLISQYNAYQSIKEQQQELQAKINDAKEKTAEFENQKQYYSSDAYIEKIAREQLGLIKSNEVLYVNHDK